MFSDEVRSSHPLDDIHLIMAGGYDERVTENREYYTELKHLADDLNLNDNITFLRSFSDSQKRTLLSNVSCLLYTPQNEHFGIVPIEAMYMQCPVVAPDSGGPLETVKDGHTGFLCQATPQHFAEAMVKFIKDDKLTKKFGENGKRHVLKKFSFNTFTDQLDTIVKDMCAKPSSASGYFVMWILAFVAMIGILLVAVLPVFSDTH